jgi:hypothetical protein
MTDLLSRFSDVRPSGAGWSAKCPAHGDARNSLSIRHADGKWLLTCHAGCTVEAIAGAVGITVADLFDDNAGGEGGGNNLSNNRATVQPSARPGLTLEAYAAAKQLPVDLLRGYGLSEITYDGARAVRIPYLSPDGEVLAVRLRVALTGDKFRWRDGSKPRLYGLNRLSEAREAGQVVLIEDESDAHIFLSYGIPALGVPGAASWREHRDAQHFEGIGKIYVVVEPDRGGEGVRRWVAQSVIRHRVLLVELPAEGVSALHLENAADFRAGWQVACLRALPWTTHEQKANAEERSEAWHQCADLAQCPSILEELDRELTRMGVVGERRVANLLYLATTSRLFSSPVSVAVKGPSAGGKSFVTASVLKLFPPPAFFPVTAMSDRALAYNKEPLNHRHLVVYEAAGMAGEIGAYMIRSLLSEGRLRYVTATKVIEREGPTGLIVTTTALRLDSDLETRLLSLTVTDTAEQTAAVLRALASKATGEADLTRWHALQAWLAAGSTKVVIPFGDELAVLVQPVDIRLKRDFERVLTLIEAHALLHQARRQKDENGNVVATVQDYSAVHELVADLVAAGVDATVRLEVRETVGAVGKLIGSGAAEVKQADLRNILRLDKSAISRRVADAVDGGYLRNLEARKGRPARLVIGEPMPGEVQILPRPERLRGCTVAGG